MHRVTTLDFDRIVFRLVQARPRAPETQRSESAEGAPVVVFWLLYLAQMVACVCIFGLFVDAGAVALGRIVLFLSLCMTLPLSLFGAVMFQLSTELRTRRPSERRTVEIQLHGTEVRVDGVSVPRHALVVKPHRVRAPGMRFDLDPPLGPEILDLLSEALEQRDRLAAAQAGGSVPAELTRLRARDSRDLSSPDPGDLGRRGASGRNRTKP